MDAIRHALAVLGWFEMRDEDRPPREESRSCRRVGHQGDGRRATYDRGFERALHGAQGRPFRTACCLNGRCDRII